MPWVAHISVSDGPLRDSAIQETNNQTAEYREQQMNSSTSDPENLKENKPSEDPETIPPDENILLPTRAVEPEQMRPDKTS